MALNRILANVQPICRRLCHPHAYVWSSNSKGLFCGHSSLMRHSSHAVELKEDNEVPDKLYKMIELEVRCNEPAILKSYGFFVDYTAKKFGIDIGKTWTPKKAHHHRFTLLRSIHVNKKCRVQYEARTYFKFMQFHRLTGSTADTFLEYIERNLPEGVSMKVTKVALEKIPEYIHPPNA